MLRSGSRRCHLTLSTAVWEEMAARAAADAVSVSVVVDRMLRNVLGLGCGGLDAADSKVFSSVGYERRRCRVSFEKPLWDRLGMEAAEHGVSVPAWIRHRLRVAVLGTDSMSAKETKQGTSSIGGHDPDDQRGPQVPSLRATKGLALCEF